jgi:putative molybdopterin biosynthesis protein
MTVSLHLTGSLVLDGAEIALDEAADLLHAIAEERSVRAAAERLGVSYRTLWGRLLDLERALGRAVAIKTKGHGTTLTEFGLELHHHLQGTFTRADTLLEAERRSLEAALTTLLAQEPTRWRLAASHDPLLMEALSGMGEIELVVTGSDEAVRRLRTGAADFAGFHFGAHEPAPRSTFAALFADPEFSVAPLFAREQGLIVSPGNPLDIGGVADLAATRARYVNRQRGSGTRAWFDRLLGEAGLRPNEIRGYEVEEFTHQAVAAVVASGAADAGMGVRAAAERFSLGFVPLGEETYFLARRAHRPASPVAAIAQGLGRVAMPGYRLTDQ